MGKRSVLGKRDRCLPFNGLVHVLKFVNAHVEVLKTTLALIDLGIEVLLMLSEFTLQILDGALSFSNLRVQFLSTSININV
jgi:hypothetical protein